MKATRQPNVLASQPPATAPELELANFGLSEADLDSVFPNVGISGLPERATLRQIVACLSETYCSSIGVEYTHITDRKIRAWLNEEIERDRNQPRLSSDEKRRILMKLHQAETLENFIHT